MRRSNCMTDGSLLFPFLFNIFTNLLIMSWTIWYSDSHISINECVVSFKQRYVMILIFNVRRAPPFLFACSSATPVSQIYTTWINIFNKPQPLHSFTIPLKYHLVEWFHSHLKSFQNSVYGENADRIYIVKTLLSFMIALWISHSLMELLAMIMLQNSCSCWWLNTAALPPARGCCAVL